MNANELHVWLRSRRSVRRFAAQQPGSQVIDRILETAAWAPNAHNRQPWRFVPLETAGSRAALAGAMGVEFAKALAAEGLTETEIEAQLKRSRDRVLEAPAAVLLCLEREVLDKYEDKDRTQGEYLMGVQSVALAGGQLLLAAHAEGLAGVWMCAPLFTPAEIRNALALPESWEAQGLILLGWPEKEPAQKERVDIDEVKRVV